MDRVARIPCSAHLRDGAAPVGDPAALVLRAVAARVHPGLRRLHLLVDLDAAADFTPNSTTSSKALLWQMAKRGTNMNFKTMNNKKI